MGKGSRKRTEKQVAWEKEILSKQQAAQHRRRRRKGAAIVIACIAAVALLAGSGVYALHRAAEDGVFLRGTTAMSSPSYTVDNAMMTYFVKSTYQSYVQNYADYLEYLQLDTSLPLSEQEQANGVTWLRYFEEQAEEQLETALLMAEAAKEAGLTLDEAQQASIDAQLETADVSSYGQGIRTEDIRRCLELVALASAYNQTLTEVSLADEEILSYYEQNKAAFETVDYLEYAFDYSDEQDSSMMREEQADSFAQALAETTDRSAFTSWVTAFLQKYSNYTTPELSEAIEDLIVEKEDHRAGDEVSDWLFDSARQANDTLIMKDKDDQTVTVYMLLTLPARDESVTKTVRHILISSSDTAEQTANDLLDEWKAGEQTEQSFAQLATAHTDDTASAASGGLYENIYSGQTVEEFENWCFASTRAPGDTGIVQTQYGYHILYFVSDGLPKWQLDATQQLLGERYDARLAQLKEAYPITVNESAIEKLSF